MNNLGESDGAVGFQLTNEERVGVGLAPIPLHWEMGRIEQIVVYFEGLVLRKYVKSDATGYLEVDLALETRDRASFFPRRHGVEYKLTAAYLLGVQRTKGCWFEAQFAGQNGRQESCLSALNTRNMRSISFWGANRLRGHAELRDYLKQRDRDMSGDRRREIEDMVRLPRQTVEYRPGDVFRFRVSDREFGFGLLLCSVSQFRKWQALPSTHPWHHVPGIPLVVRLFNYVSTSEGSHLDGLVSQMLLPAQLMLDDEIFWGEFPIVSHRTLTPQDVDFPCICTKLVSKRPEYFLSWGPAAHRIVWPENYPNIKAGMSVGRLETTLLPPAIANQRASIRSDLRDHGNASVLRELFAQIGYEGAPTYAAYAAWAGCMSPSEFIARIGEEPTKRYRPYAAAT